MSLAGTSIMWDSSLIQVAGYAAAALVGWVAGYLALRRTIDRIEKVQEKMRGDLESLRTTVAKSATKDDLRAVATKEDLQPLARSAETAAKGDLRTLATKEDLQLLARTVDDRMLQLERNDASPHFSRGGREGLRRAKIWAEGRNPPRPGSEGLCGAALDRQARLSKSVFFAFPDFRDT